MPIKNAPATPLPWKTSGGCLNPHLSMTLDADAHRIDAAYITHTANAYPKLVEALRSAVDAIPAEYCGHEGQCGADVKGCYVRKFAALMRELGED